MSRMIDDLEPLDAPDEGQNLIFLISQPRAGATGLQRVLGKHDEIHTASEPWVMMHPLYALKEKGVQAAYDAEASVNALRGFLAGLSGGEQSYYDALRAFGLTLYEKALLNSRKTYFLDHTPRYYMVYEELRRTFPRARFMIFVRNPFGVLASNVRTLVGTDPEKLKERREDLLQAPRRLSEAAQSGDPNLCVVRYEELIESPEAAMAWIYGFLGLRAPDDPDHTDLHAGEPGRSGRQAKAYGESAHQSGQFESVSAEQGKQAQPSLEAAPRLAHSEPLPSPESIRRRKAEDEWDVGEEPEASVVPGVQLGGAAASRAEKAAHRAERHSEEPESSSPSHRHAIENESESADGSENEEDDQTPAKPPMFKDPYFNETGSSRLNAATGSGAADDWYDLLAKDPQFWRLAAEYLEKLGRPLVERLGYSYDDLEQALADTRPDDRNLLTTRGLPW